MTERTRAHVAEGITRIGNRLRATVKARGVQRERWYAVGTSLRTIQDWRDRERGRLKDDRPAAARGTFAKDADRYLDTLSDRPKLKRERTYQLEWWRIRFGALRRTSIQSPDIRAALADLRTTKAASTCNHYRMALAHLWTTLDGKDARNPLRDVPVFQEPEAEPRNLAPGVVDQIFAALAKLGPTRKGQKRARVSLAELRLRVMYATGLSPAEIMRITPGDLALPSRAVYVRRRLKGKGAEGMLLPLTAQGVTALEAFAAADAFGPFSTHAVYRCWVRACKRLRKADVGPALDRILRSARPYDLRHSFGTWLLQGTGDLAATKELMRHRSTKTTKRYVRAAVAPHLRLVIDRLSNAETKPSTPQATEEKDVADRAAAF